MAGLDWAAMMRVGLGELRLSPPVFWSLSPAELMLMVNPAPAAHPLGRSGLDDLIAAFPDGKEFRDE